MRSLILQSLGNPTLVYWAMILMPASNLSKAPIWWHVLMILFLTVMSSVMIVLLVCMVRMEMRDQDEDGLLLIAVLSVLAAPLILIMLMMAASEIIRLLVRLDLLTPPPGVVSLPPM